MKSTIPMQSANGTHARGFCFSDSLEEEAGFVWDGRYIYIYTNLDSYEPLAQIHNWINEDGEGDQQAHYFHCDQIGIPRKMTDDKGDLVQGLLRMGNKCVLILQENRYVKFN